MEEETEWENLLSLYESFPASELIIHPRLREDYYQGKIREEAFAQAYRDSCAEHEQTAMQLCYNGDIVSREQIQKLADAYPELHAVMIGRGFLMRPGFTAGLLRQNGEMPGETAETGGLETEKDVNKDKFWNFHDRIYEGYRSYLQGDKPVLFKMKELWSYLQVGLSELAGESKPKTDKLMKQLRKCNTCADYDSVIRQLKLLCR